MKMLSRGRFIRFFRNILYESPILLQVRKSALYISSAKATETFVYVIPHIDYPVLAEQKDVIEKQLAQRKLSFDLQKLENLWTMYEELKQRKTDLVHKKAEISKELGILLKTEPDSDNTRKSKIQISLIKDNLKKIKYPLWSAEEAAIVEALKLPNLLHPQTPDNEAKIIFEYLTAPKNDKNHLEVGKKLKILEYNDHQSYYLKGEAAIFELGANFYFSSFLKQNNFIQFSNPDFVKSVIIEGCGTDYTNSDSTFILYHNEDSEVNANARLHLTGGASLFSYFAYHSKNVIYSKVLPLRYYTIGRQYVPNSSRENSKYKGLFSVNQSSAIHFFGVTKHAEELNIVLNDLIGILKMIYCQIGYPFRICVVAADKLSHWESMRVSIEMFSVSSKTYVEIGNISVSGDFISKRLMYSYIDNKQSMFPHILSGTLLNVPRFLACALEQDEEFTLPFLFRPENWSM